MKEKGIRMVVDKKVYFLLIKLDITKDIEINKKLKSINLK